MEPVLYEKLSMEKASKIAKQLQKFAKEQHLSVTIAGKQYMQAEGWQFVGAHMGLTDVVEYCDPVESKDPKEIKYKAAVKIINQHGAIISRGIAYCSSKESKRKGFEEYAIASMAQTRAVGKAYRNFLAWIVKMAGYETTPAEEIDRDMMETNLTISKQQVYKALIEAGIIDSSEQVKTIETAIGKAVIETTDEAHKVIGYIKEIEE